MKKILFLSLFSFITIIGFTQELRNDNNFVELVNLKIEFVNQILINFKGDLKNLTDFQSEMEKMSNEEKIDFFNSKVKLPEGKDLTYYANAFNEKWIILKNTYEDRITNEYLTEEISFLLNESNSKLAPLDLGGELGVGIGPCDRPKMFAGCTAAAYAGALICHGGCLTTTLAVFACFAACGTLEAWAIVVCHDTYCTPKAN
jgi:hypothetical protein